MPAASSRTSPRGWCRRRKPSGGRSRANCTMKWASRSRRSWSSCAIFRPASESDRREQSRSHVETIKGLVESTVRVVRNMALLLRPSMLDDLGLIPALKWQARESAKRTSMDVSVATELDSDDLPDEYKTCIYRVVQEALA